MKFYNSIISRTIIMTIVMIIFWIWAGLSVSDKINKSFYQQELTNEIQESKELSLKISSRVFKLIDLASPGSHDEVYNQGLLEQDIISLVSSLNILLADPDISENLVLKRKINLIRENLNEINRISNEYLILLKDKGNINQGFLSDIKENLDANREYQNLFISYLLNYNPAIIEGLINDFTTENIDNTIPENQDLQEISENSLLQMLKKLALTDYKLGYYQKNGATGSLLLMTNQIMEQLISLQEDYSRFSQDALSRYYKRFFAIFLFFAAMVIFILLITVNQSLKRLEEITNPLDQLSRGILPENLITQRTPEFKLIMRFIKNITDNLRQKMKFAQLISEEGQLSSEIDFPENDEFGNELKKMAEKLRKAREEDLIHKEEARRRNWHSEGLASFGEIFRSERDNLAELAFKVIRKLVKYLDANQGSLFIINDEDEKNIFLETIATFAFDRRKFIKSKIDLGEGLAGTCAQEKETIYINEVPDDYIFITSGLGDMPPKSLLLVPLKLENEIFGVLEIASVKTFEDYEINFAEHLAESIATTLAGVRINEKTSKLLEQSQMQAKDMQDQEERMRKNMEALERAQDESRIKEMEITGILNAVNSSSLVAEFSLNGRFAEINEKFLDLLETSKEQVIGKHHSDFAEVDKYGEHYKKFWLDLREGQNISRIEKFKLFSGKELWLNMTFTPIQDKDGKTIKILNITSDITQTKLQQASLEEQANEITRKSIEMRSLSDAVDQSIIKCEHSPEGIIINANQNYCEITGLSIKELIGKNARLFLKDDEKKQFDSIMEQVLKDKSYTGVVKRSKPTGEEIWLMANFTPVHNEENDIYKIYFLAQDITEKKLKYQLLEEANKEIDRLKEEIKKTGRHE